MRTEDIRLLLDVAHQGSFTDAANARGLTPSSVSRTVSSIEKRLGFLLFHRRTRRITLTKAGQMYARRIAWVVDKLDRARDDALAVTAGTTGTLRMTTGVAFGQRVIVPLVPKFRAVYPQVSLDLLLSDENPSLVAERIDLAVRLDSRVPLNAVASRLVRTAYRVCASPDYVIRHDQLRTPADLADHDCLLLARPGLRPRWRFRDPHGRTADVQTRGTIVASGALALHELVLAGMGPALLPDWLVADDVEQGRLIDLFPSHRVTAKTAETGVWLVYSSRAFLPRKVRAMIDFLRHEVGSVAPGAGPAHARSQSGS